MLPKSCQEQLEKWCNGESVHNNDPERGKGGECCPDFSCCHPEMAWPIEKRVAFTDADPAEREEMCFGSLSDLLDLNEVRKVAIIKP